MREVSHRNSKRLSRAHKRSAALRRAIPKPYISEFLEPRMLLAFGPVGGPFRVDASPNYHVAPSVATAADGSFVVTWTGEDSSFAGIRARRYNAAGQPLGSDFVVNTTTLNYQR